MELESQVAKIQLGAEKGAETFVYINAEKLPLGESESFLVAEILESDSNLQPDCEKIALSIQAAVRRVFKKSAKNDEAFESAIAHVNDELGKLASLGQTHWIDKLNSIIGVKTQNIFNIATTGKVAAFLMRDNELTDISCSVPKAHPLKTFENFATGKLKLGDLLILSTNQLFNHISIDRLKRLLMQDDFLRSTGQLVEVLKANTSGQVAFGSILALQSEPGSSPSEEINLEEYIETHTPSAPSRLSKIRQFFVSMVFPGSRIRPELPRRLPWKNRLTNFGSKAKTFGGKTAGLWKALAQGVRFGKENLKPAQIRQFSPQKKFFFFSIIALLLAVILQIFAAAYISHKKTAQSRVLFAINQAQKDLSDADAALLYKDGQAAREFYLKSMAALNNIKEPNKTQQQQIDQIKSQSEEIKAKLEKTVEVAGENLGALGSSAHLIKLPEFLAVQTDRQIVSFNKNDKSIRDDLLKIATPIALAESADKNRAIIYTGEALRVWIYNASSVGEPFASNVPTKENAVGLKFYSVNQRVYLLDKSNNKILNFAVLGDTLGRPLVAANLKNDDGKNAIDLAVDGSLYILTGNDIKKYHAGQPAGFGPLALLTPLREAKAIYTKPGFANIYILDSGNKRIVVLNKKAEIVYTLISREFTDLVDFEVDEKGKTIYVLNGSSLLKILMP